MLYLVETSVLYYAKHSEYAWAYTYKIETERPSSYLFFTRLILEHELESYLIKYARLHNYSIEGE